MSEPTPAPTPNRAVYGFAWFVFSKTLFVLFIFWALVPDYIQRDVLGLTYLPDKYFAMLLPVWVLTALTFFAFLIYPSWNMAMQDDINDIHTIRDSRTTRRCQYVFIGPGIRCENKVKPIAANESNNFNMWKFERFCLEHSESGQEQENKNQDDTIDPKRYANYCDCVDKINCLLQKRPNHVKLLRNRATVPSISDLDIADVSKQLFLET